MPLSSLPGIPADHRARLLKAESRDLSALTVFREGLALIVVNDAHTPQRQVNSITHELSHVILGHETADRLDADGQRHYPQRLEDEANWLAGALLVPVGQLRQLLAELGGQPAVADHFGVSLELVRWRCNMHGLARRAA